MGTLNGLSRYDGNSFVTFRPEGGNKISLIEHTTPLDEVVRTGEIIDAAISQRLIENIFFKNSPLHDGAMVISKKRIKAAGQTQQARQQVLF